MTFDSNKCTFFKDDLALLTGYRDHRSGLYLLPRAADDIDLSYSSTATFHNKDITSPIGLGLPKQTIRTNCNAYALRDPTSLVQYLHACAGFPTKATWTKAINQDYYIGWPGLTASRVTKYLPKSEATVMGHQKLTRQGVRSTYKGANDDYEHLADNEDCLSSKGASRTKLPLEAIGRQRSVMVCSVPIKDMRLKGLKGMIGTDQTGRFPVTSDRGHKYVFILFDTDVNLIYGVPIKNRKPSELIRAYNECYDTLTNCGFTPVLHCLDNETSAELYEAIKAKDLTYETVPPRNHRRNPAERAIQTFKAHFISILNGVDERFPEGAWDYLLPQTNMTLNMLRPCTVNPAHSAYSHVHGAFNYNAHPLAPLGCRAIVHERAVNQGGRRGAWGNRGCIGYYIGPVMESYRVWEFYMPDTKSTVKADTAEFFPNIPLPVTTPESQIISALNDIQMVLGEP